MWPAAAGILVVGAGAGWGLIADAATFAVSAAVLSRRRLDHAPPTPTAGPLAAAALDGMLALAGGLMLLQTSVLVPRPSVRRLAVEPASIGAG
ncbi:MAG: hypothetical protein ACYCUG_08620 [Acidimicrobiales bacterium]